MYNRYIPQGDGSYRRNPMPDPGTPPQPMPPAPKPPPPPKPLPPPGADPLGVGRFLRQLLPGDFDTEDLLIVLLLLLLRGDRGEDPNAALLTLALYLFL